jgi:vancomycin permeability regulator SanA
MIQPGVVTVALQSFLRTLRAFLDEHRRLLIWQAVLLLLAIALVTINFIFIGRYARYIQSPQIIPQDRAGVAVVLGGGVEGGMPRPLLRDRLDTAAKLLKENRVRKLLLSGDNRFAGYNEPEVMKNYLVNQKGIDASFIEVDFAGRSTYETCERSKKVFGLDRAFFVSESTHLPRVLYLCRSFGIQAYGVKSDGESSAGLKVGQRSREVFARTKATLNVYIYGERTVLGAPVKL